MPDSDKPIRNLIEGRPVLIVTDIQISSFTDTADEDSSIPHMPGYARDVGKARSVIDAARKCNVPVVFIQEVHRPDLVDFGRELDGSEGVHCLENEPNTEIAKEQLGFLPDDYVISKRRYSAFFGTDLEILLC